MGNHLYHEAASRGNCMCNGNSPPLPSLSFPSLAVISPLFSKNRAKTDLFFFFPHQDEIIDLLLDQPNFECDPVNRQEGDTPLHTAIRWINSEPPAQREFGSALVDMMLEAGSSTRIRNRARLTPSQLVDPSNAALRELIQRHEYANLNAGDFVEVGEPRAAAAAQGAVPVGKSAVRQEQAEESDDDAEFSGSDDEERAEWERRRKERRARKG